MIWIWAVAYLSVGLIAGRLGRRLVIDIAGPDLIEQWGFAMLLVLFWPVWLLCMLLFGLGWLALNLWREP